MKIFISSLITGFQDMRQVAKSAVETLRYKPIMAEDFGAQPNSPQVACLQGFRQSDAVVLILGERYRSVQGSSGLSPTHEEYREAKGRKPIFAFVQNGVTPEPAQAEFIAEVQKWEGGLFREAFRDAADLQMVITRALHDYALANAVSPLDPQALVAQAIALLQLQRSNRYSSSGSARLWIAIAGGPIQQILRPVEIENQDLKDALHREALFGSLRLFDGAMGVNGAIEQGALVLEQERGARIQLDEKGSVLIGAPLTRQSRGGYGSGFQGSVLLEEIVIQQLANCLAYSNWVLEHVDATQRLTHVAIAAIIKDADHMAWYTQRELDASPNSISMGAGFGAEHTAVSVNRPRAALRLDHSRVVEDLLVPLRRQWKNR